MKAYGKLAKLRRICTRELAGGALRDPWTDAPRNAHSERLYDGDARRGRFFKYQKVLAAHFLEVLTAKNNLISN